MVVENLRGSGQKVSVGVRCRAGKAVVDLINQRRVASAHRSASVSIGNA